MFVLLVRYKCKQGCRDRYYEAIREKHIDEMSRAEEGCLRYEYSYGMAEDELLLTEVWQDAEAIEFHKNSEHFAKLGELKAEYVENTEFMKFSAEQMLRTMSKFFFLKMMDAAGSIPEAILNLDVQI